MSFSWGLGHSPWMRNHQVFEDSWMEFMERGWRGGGHPLENSNDPIINKLRRNGLYLGEIPQEDRTDEYCREAFSCDKRALKFIPPEKQSLEMCIEAVNSMGRGALEWVADKNPKVCLAAVRREGTAIGLVPEQTEALCLEAVKQCGFAIKEILQPSQDVLYAAIRQNPNALGEIRNPSRDLCLEAIRLYGNALSYVREQDEELVLAAFPSSPGQRMATDTEVFQTMRFPQNYRVCLAAVKHNPFCLKYVKPEFKTPELCLAAVRVSSAVFSDVPEPTEEIYLEACRQDEYDIKVEGRDIPESIAMALVRQNPMVLKVIPYASKEVCLEAVRLNGLALEYSRFKTKDICSIAASENSGALEFVPEQYQAGIRRSLGMCWTTEKSPENIQVSTPGFTSGKGRRAHRANVTKSNKPKC
jgi:hypothetical protein